ncbi:hypothetical protein [Sandarakinorhabdus sp.]|uniref:hypothetical protein n=1 Tax=Sandarakinorhabdus sp. TaxID=1916663 RepID=UPI003F70A7BC
MTPSPAGSGISETSAQSMTAQLWPSVMRALMLLPSVPRTVRALLAGRSDARATWQDQA